MAEKDQVKILIAHSIHREGILKLAETVVITDEPIQAAIGTIWDENVKRSWEELVDLSILEQVSHVAVNGRNDVIGFRLSRILDMKTLQPNDSIYNWVSEGHLKNISLRLTSVWSKELPHTGKVLHFLSLCVHPAYGNKGLAMQLVQANINLGKQLGCKAVVVMASNWMSQHVFEKAGFRIINVFYYKDYKNDKGQEILAIPDKKQTCAKFYVKNID